MSILEKFLQSFSKVVAAESNSFLILSPSESIEKTLTSVSESNEIREEVIPRNLMMVMSVL